MARTMTKMNWTPEKDAVLLECNIAGDTIKGAAQLLKTTEYHIKKRAAQLGITFATRRLSEQGKEFIREHFGRDMNPTEIAREIGFSTSTVYYWSKKFGLCIPDPSGAKTEGEKGEKAPAWRIHKEFWQHFARLTEVDLDKELLVKSSLRTVVEMLSDFGRGVFLRLCRGKSVKHDQFALFKLECFWLSIPFLEVVAVGTRHAAFLREEFL